MRVAAGQAVHRDFYYQYGPANIYLLAALFKLFGQSVLIERTLWIVEAASMVAVVFILLDRFAGRKVALATVIGCLLWPDALSWLTLGMVSSTWLIGTNFERRISGKAAFLAGLLAGSTVLFRYDVGIAVAGAQIVLILAAAMMHERRVGLALREGLRTLGPYLGGFAVLVGPLFIWYVAQGILPGLVYDVLTYPSKYYYAGRNLPFPHLHRQNFEDVVVYVFPLLIGLSLFHVFHYWFGSHRRRSSDAAVPRWVGPVASFGLIAAIAYLKTLVRMGAGPLFLCAAPCLVLGAVLVACRQAFGLVSKTLIGVLLTLFAIGGVSSRWHDRRIQNLQGSSMASWIFAHSTQAPYPPFNSWCNDRNPLSKGFCFFDDNNRIQAIEYLESHTRPGETLYVGLSHHDRIFVGDNVTYFATQRLPAVKWTQFDPFLQNRADIQTQMIEDLERNRSPYVMLDAEFENAGEPNGSSVSTGVHLLDDYIASHYTFAARFGELTILQRQQ